MRDSVGAVKPRREYHRYVKYVCKRSRLTLVGAGSTPYIGSRWAQIAAACMRQSRTGIPDTGFT